MSSKNRLIQRRRNCAELHAQLRQTLFAKARLHWNGPERSLRRRIDSFLRLYRNNLDYLRWLLRTTRRCAIMAALVLGLFASPANADVGPFVQANDGTHPLTGFTAGYLSAPTFVDLDNDGDKDLVSGAFYGFFVYFENTGSATNAAFVQRTGAQNPFNGFDVGFVSAPTFADLDNDGDFDLMSGEYDGVFNYFENTGTAASPAFIARTGIQNPLLFDVGFVSSPAFLDIDNDGDFDIIAGDSTGAFNFFQNTGTASSPILVWQVTTANPLFGMSTSTTYAAPAFVDIDNDGDLDLFAGNFEGDFEFFENTGSASNPKFIVRTGALNPLSAFPGANEARPPAFADLDNDGDFDLVSGEYFPGIFHWFTNTGTPSSPAFVQGTGELPNPLLGFDIGFDSSPAMADLDNDGDLDLLSGASGGTFAFLENAGDNSNPTFIQRFGALNPLNGVDIGTHSGPAFADIDDDGDFDLIVGSLSGAVFYFENTGGVLSPAFISRTGAQNPFDGIVFNETSPAFADLDDDGDLDLLIGDGDYGEFQYFENTGSASSPAFIWRTGAQNPLDAVVGIFSPHAAFADLDLDGDLDLLVGEFDGVFHYFENTGSASSPSFVQRTGAQNPFAAFNLVRQTAPIFVDLDNDGDLDVVSGADDGRFYYFQNQAPVVVPPSVPASSPGVVALLTAALIALGLRKTKPKV